MSALALRVHCRPEVRVTRLREMRHGNCSLAGFVASKEKGQVVKSSPSECIRERWAALKCALVSAMMDVPEVSTASGNKRRGDGHRDWDAGVRGE